MFLRTASSGFNRARGSLGVRNRPHLVAGRRGACHNRRRAPLRTACGLADLRRAARTARLLFRFVIARRVFAVVLG